MMQIIEQAAYFSPLTDSAASRECTSCGREASLIAGLQKKDRRALEQVIDRYTNYVGTILQNILGRQGSREDQEELASDVFLSLWEHAPEMQTDNLKAYLASIARTKALNWLRKNHVDVQPLEDMVVVDDTDISAETELAELGQILQELLELLPVKDREILIRYYFYYQPVREIARELHMKEATVKTRMHRSRKKLRQLFTERGYGYEQMEFI